MIFIKKACTYIKISRIRVVTNFTYFTYQRLLFSFAASCLSSCVRHFTTFLQICYFLWLILGLTSCCCCLFVLVICRHLFPFTFMIFYCMGLLVKMLYRHCSVAFIFNHFAFSSLVPSAGYPSYDGSINCLHGLPHPLLRDIFCRLGVSEE